MELIPRPWQLEEPPEPWLRSSLTTLSPAPLVLLLDRRSVVRPEGLTELEAWLDPFERERLAALRRPLDRQRFLLARAALRRLLGAWRCEDPARVPVAIGDHGKPFCPGGPQFNLSHGGDLILLALHPSQPVGVDVERQRPSLHWRPLAKRVLPEGERLALLELPPEERPDGFLRAWCRLEARLKARGWGLAGLERLKRETQQPSSAPDLHWELPLPAGYRGAVSCLQGSAHRHA